MSGLFAAWAVDDGFYVIPVTKMAVPKGAIIMWSGEIDNDGHPVINGQPDKKWQACDGNNGTPDLRDRFVRGASFPGEIGVTGGSDTVTLGVNHLPHHDHSGRTGGEKGHVHPFASMYLNHETTTLWYMPGLSTSSLVSSLDYYAISANTSPSLSGHDHGIGGSGGGASFANIPAYYALTFIMYLGN